MPVLLFGAEMGLSVMRYALRESRVISDPPRWSSSGHAKPLSDNGISGRLDFNQHGRLKSSMVSLALS